MYFAIVKFGFDVDSAPPSSDGKDFAALAEKVRARFKVCAAIHVPDSGDESGIALVVAALGSQEERLSQTIDAIAEFCESQGFGRIGSEDALMDHIDAVSDYTEDGDV